MKPLKALGLAAVVVIALLLMPTLAFGHDIGQPHTDPPPPEPGGDGASPVLIIAGVVMTLVVAGFLVWAKQRAVAGDADDATPSADLP